MNDTSFMRRLTAVTAVLSAPLAVMSLVLALGAVEWNFAALDDPASQVGIGASAAGLLRGSMLLDLAGYYLLVAPAALYLWFWLRRRAPFGASLITLAGLAYVLVGSIGAAVLAEVWPPLVRDYAAATGAERELARALFTFATHFVYHGLWNLLEILLAAVWWGGAGLLLWRERPAFAATSLVLGAACALDGLGNLGGVPALSSIGLNLYLVLAPVWALWLGILAARGVGVEATS